MTIRVQGMREIPGRRRSAGRRFPAWLGLLGFGVAVFLFAALRFVHFSTSSAKIFLLRETTGLRLSLEEPYDAPEKVVARIDATPLFNALFEKAAAATETPLLDLDYDPGEGKGLIKAFRPDGTRLEIALSRYDTEDAHPHGLILGGNFSAADSRGDRNGSGFALHDGERWIHLWCTANEGIALTNGDEVYEPHRWRYVSGRIIERSRRAVELESTHHVDLEGRPVEIVKRLRLEAGDNFFDLTTTVRNRGEEALTFEYAYGDEPWIGDFGSSRGDVGWFDGGIVTRERYIDGSRHSFVGYADIGNPEFRETGRFTGYANYIRWIGTRPSEVYFSNSFFSVEDRVLGSTDNRVLSIVWHGQSLRPGESKSFHLQIGFVPPGKFPFLLRRDLAAVRPAAGG